MRYTKLALVLVVIGSASAFACGDDVPSNSLSHAGSAGKSGTAGDVGSGGSSAGKGGTTASGGTAGSGTAGKGGTAGAGGAAGQSGGAGEGGTAGESGAAGDAGAAGAGPQGDSLQVTISGAPTGSTVNATVAGPAGFSRSVSTTTTLTNLAAGSYTVTAPALAVDGPQVDSIFDATITGSPATVQADVGGSVAVSYARRPGTGMMWVTSAVTRSAFGFSAAQIAATGTQAGAANVALTLPNLGTTSPAAISLAFSSTSDAWVGYCRGGQTPQVLAKFSPAKLAATGAPTADVVLTLPSIDATYDCAGALAFDTAGNLWVGMNHGHVIRYNASDLVASGTPTPAVTLTNTTYFNGIVDIAFDAAGNLFVGAYFSPAIARLSAAQLATSNAAVVPAVLLTLPAGTGVGGLTLGAGGNLWVADYAHNSVVRFNAANLTASGTPAPSVNLTGIAGPEQLAFDGAGNLWVASFNTSTVLAFTPAPIAVSGGPAALTTLNAGGALDSTYAVRFNPGTP